MNHAALRLLVAVGLGALSSGCGAPLPDDVVGYQSRCVLMNGRPIPPYERDPHRGMKNVYACNVTPEQVAANQRPFPEGALIVKESTRVGQDFVWLVALARKQAGAWQWNEYTRNFADEELRHGLASRAVCTDCHGIVEDQDWIFTRYTRE